MPARPGRAVRLYVARNHLINCAKRARIVSFDVVVDLDAVSGHDVLDPERHLLAREELRRIQLGLEQLPPRCREVVLLRKIRGLSTRQTADELGIGVDTVEKQMTFGMRALANFMLGGSAKVQRSRVPGLLARRPAR